LLTACREIASRHLNTALPTLIERVDDALFELANKSENHTRQAHYFEVVRQIRLERHAMAARFNDALTEAMSAELCPRESATRAQWWGDAEPGDLGLVNADEMEESLAVTNTGSKIKSNCKSQLFALDRRVGWLLQDSELTTRSNHLGPESTCNVIRTAFDQLDVDIEVKLLILKLLDKEIASDIDSIFAEMNEHLVKNDVLPEIKTEIKRTPGPARPASNIEPASPVLHAGDQNNTGAAHPNTGNFFNGVMSGQMPAVANAPALLSTMQQVMNVNGVPAEAATQNQSGSR